MKARQRLEDILHCYDTEPTEVFDATTALLWGLWLLNPFAQTFTMLPVYASMRALAPEWVWGATFTAFGLLRLWATLTDQRPLRKTLAFAGALCWIFVVVTLAIHGLANTGVPIYASMSFRSAWVSMRIGAT